MKLKRIWKLTIIIILILVLFTFTKNLKKNDVKETIEYEINKIIDNDEKKVKLTLVGDFLFEQPYYDSIDSGEDKNNYFSLVKDYFKSDDISIGNMEVVVSDGTLNVSGEGFNFCAPTYVGEMIKDLDMEVLSLANNHSFDRGIDGVNSTINYFKNNSDILTVGTNNSEVNLDNYIIEKNDITFGFLSYTYGTNQSIPENYKYSVNTFKENGTFTNEKKEKIKNEINYLRKKVDVLIFLVHWGVEFTHEVNNEQIELRDFLHNEKVDIIVGGHSHSIEPIEWISSDNHKTLVYYSLGNFVSADEDISRTGEHFDNAYQFGLLSNLEIEKNNDEINIKNITTEPIINYYDINKKNFLLIPYSKYSNEYEVSHYRYKDDFTKEFINNTFNEVINEEFR